MSEKPEGHDEVAHDDHDNVVPFSGNVEDRKTGVYKVINVETLAAEAAAAEADAGESADDLIPPDPGSEDAASPRLQSIVESLLFASDRPLSLKQLGDLVGETELARIRAAVAAIEVGYGNRGFQLQQVAGGYQFRTNAENAEWVQKLLAQKPIKLSRALLETLAIVSYRQPITRPEIDEIRGVDSGGTLKTLMDRSLIKIIGKQEAPGRPMLYGTSVQFLEFFNLGDLKDLPTLREFQELSEEHQAQVAALEGVAPKGMVETAEEAALRGEQKSDAFKPVDLQLGAEDEVELEAIDRLIESASVRGDSTSEFQRGVKRDEPADDEFDAAETTSKRVHSDDLPS